MYRLDPLLRAATALDSAAGAIHRFADSLAQPALVEHAADDPLALWSPLRTHSLRLRLGEETTRTDLDGHIRDWLSSLTETMPGNAEEVASVAGPSRDLRFAAVLMLHHFTAVTNLAVRPIDPDDSLHEHPSQGFAGLWTRQATPEDLPALTDMAVQLQRFDTNFGLFGIRQNAEAHLRAELRTMLAGEPELTWILESDAGLAGFTQVHTTQQSPWATEPYVDPLAAGYLCSMFVDPAVRGRGGGGLLAEAARRCAAHRGWTALLLHHAVANPWSAPFWARQGYRPLLTTWQRRPLTI